jgi:hypothetical protein
MHTHIPSVPKVLATAALELLEEHDISLAYPTSEPKSVEIVVS